jgi:hypothetical protein
VLAFTIVVSSYTIRNTFFTIQISFSSILITTTMARLTSFLLLISATSVLGFTPRSTVPVQSVASTTSLQESFGFDFAEDQAENTPSVILGEANYKQWVGENIDNSFLNRQVRRIIYT